MSGCPNCRYNGNGELGFDKVVGMESLLKCPICGISFYNDCGFKCAEKNAPHIEYIRDIGKLADRTMVLEHAVSDFYNELSIVDQRRAVASEQADKIDGNIKNLNHRLELQENARIDDRKVIQGLEEKITILEKYEYARKIIEEFSPEPKNNTNNNDAPYYGWTINIDSNLFYLLTSDELITLRDQIKDGYMGLNHEISNGMVMRYIINQIKGRKIEFEVIPQETHLKLNVHLVKFCEG
jgi:hypothetical protein